MIGKNEVWKLLYPEKDCRKEIIDKITEIIRKNNYLENLRTTIVCKNGTHKIILWNTRGLPGEADKSSQFIAIGVDITDRTHAEEELKRSEERYRQFFNTSRDCVFITTPDGRWIDLNDAAVEFFGYGSREELQKVKLSDLYEDPSERDRHLRYINERGYSKEYPVNLRKKDGTIINTLITSVAIKDDKGKITSYEGTIWDITERKRAEETLRESEEQFRVIFHNQPAGLLMIDPSTHMIVDTNAATLAMIGASREEVIGKVCHTFICPAEQGKCPITDLNQVVDNSERVLITKNGRKIPILKSVNSITIKGRRFLIESFIDITEQKRAEEIINKG